DAVQAIRSLDAQERSLQEARASAEAALQLAETRYAAGIGTQLDVLAAQRPLLQVEQQLAALRAQRYLATVDLDRALGGGLSFDAPATTSLPDACPPPSPMTTDTNPQATAPAGNGKRTRALKILLSVLVLAGAAWLAWYLVYARWHEDTDDA